MAIEERDSRAREQLCPRSRGDKAILQRKEVIER